MLTFLQYIAEIWKPERAIKGWMSPSGTAHLIDPHTEHKDSHHPEYLKQGGKQGDHLQHAQAKGFVRFGGNINSMHGFHHFVHYDAKHPEGKKTALKALRYMKPDHNDEVTVSGNAGVFKKSAKTGKLYKNAKAVKELDRDAIMPASHAYRHLQSEAFLEEEHLPVKIKQHPKNPSAYLAYHGRKRVGAAVTWNDLNHGKFSIYKSETHPDYRQKGVMRQLYHHIEKTTGKQLHPASALSDDGHKFWSKYRPEAVKDDLRNHTHKLMGKDVSHPMHGPGKIERVGSGGASVRMPNGNTYFLKKDHDEVKKHLNDISESVDSAKLRKAANHNDAYHILDSHHGTKGGTPAAGGCGVFAHALHKHLPGSKLVDIHNKNTGHTEHVGVHHGDHVYDAYGAHPAKHFVSRFQKREGVHGDLEMTDHHPERTAKSDISTHPGTVAKMHSHLGKFL